MRYLAGLGLCLCACQSPSSIDDVPEGVRWVAALSVERGSLLASQLRRKEESQALPFFLPPDSEHYFVGYGEGQLSAVDPKLKLRARQRCEPRMPTPSWYAKLDRNGALQTLDPALAPDLTADWLPTVSASQLSVHVSCRFTVCVKQLTDQVDGNIRADLNFCNMGQYIVQANALGEICAAPLGPAKCQPDPQGDRMDCSELEPGCEARFFIDTPSPIERLETVNVLGEPPRRLSTFEDDPYLYPDDVTIGYLYDFLARDRDLIVSGPSGPPTITNCQSMRLPTQLLHYNEALEQIGTSTAPDCLSWMASDENDGYFAAFKDDDGWRIGRFSAEGRALATHPTESFIVNTYGREVLRPMRMRGLQTSENRLHVLIEGRRSTPGTFLITLDKTTLALEHHHQLEDEVRTHAAVSDHEVVWAKRSRFCRFDVVQGRCTNDGELPPNISDFFHIHAARSSQDVLFAGSDHSIFYWRSDELGALPQQIYHHRQRGLHPSRVVPGAPGAPWWVLNLGASPEKGAAPISYLSAWVPEQYFIGPTLFPIGEGVVSRARMDSQGRLLALFPWTGQLVRLKLR